MAEQLSFPWAEANELEAALAASQERERLARYCKEAAQLIADYGFDLGVLEGAIAAALADAAEREALTNIDAALSDTSEAQPPMIECGPCSRAGHADRAVMHEAPARREQPGETERKARAFDCLAEWLKFDPNATWTGFKLVESLSCGRCAFACDSQHSTLIEAIEAAIQRDSGGRPTDGYWCQNCSRVLCDRQGDMCQKCRGRK